MAEVVTFKLETREFENLLRRYAVATDKSFAEVIRRQARLICVNLAKQTQPFGDKKGDSALGEGAIASDFKILFKPLNRFWFDEAKRMQKLDPESFRRRFTNKNGETWLSEEDKILNGSGDAKSFHQSMRTKGGRRRASMAGTETRDIGRTRAGNRGVIIADQLKSYLKKVQLKVGIAKAGWASCAKQLRIPNAMRGIPQWVTRHADKRASGQVEDKSETNGNNPYVILRNMVPWIDKCLTASQMQRALDMQSEKMLTDLDAKLSNRYK